MTNNLPFGASAAPVLLKDVNPETLKAYGITAESASESKSNNLNPFIDGVYVALTVDKAEDATPEHCIGVKLMQGNMGPRPVLSVLMGLYADKDCKSLFNVTSFYQKMLLRDDPMSRIAIIKKDDKDAHDKAMPFKKIDEIEIEYQDEKGKTIKVQYDRVELLPKENSLGFTPEFKTIGTLGALIKHFTELNFAKKGRSVVKQGLLISNRQYTAYEDGKTSRRSFIEFIY